MHLDGRLLREARCVRLLLLLAVGAGLAGTALTVAQAGLVSHSIRRVFLDGRSLPQVWGLLLCLLPVMAGRSLFSWAGEVAAARAAGRVKVGIRRRLLDHVFALGPAYVRGERTGELTATLVDGVEALEGYFSQYLPQLFVAALVPLAILAVVLPRDPLSGLVLLFTGPLVPLFTALIGKAADALSRAQWRSLQRMSGHFLDVLQGLPTLKLFGRSREQADEIARVSDHFRETSMGVLRIAFLSAFALEMIATLSTAIVAVEIGLRLLYGRIGFEDALFILILAPEFYLPLRTLGARFHAGLSGCAAAERIFAILDAPAPAAPGSASPGRPAGWDPAVGRAPALSFAGVSFAYDSGTRPALAGATFEAAPGRTTAVVGPTGSGKSTLAALLLRFIEPGAGRILVDGVPLGEIPADEWRRQVAWVPEKPYLFAGTIAENIAMGRSDASPGQIRDAARQACADHFVLGLPQGYDTQIGERGVRLSAGQAQRVALARAILRDAPVVILDEATAHLDAGHEADVQASLRTLLAGRTVLVIAHRPQAIAHADRVVHLESGTVCAWETPGGDNGDNGDGTAAGRYPAIPLSGNPGIAPPVHPSIPFSDGNETVPGDAANSRATPKSAICNLQSAIGITPSPVQAGVSVGGPEQKPGASGLSVLLRLVRLAAPFRKEILLSVLLGAATIGSSIGLMATSAYIIARAALHPSVGELGVAIVGVRFFGLARGIFRYLDRLVSHQAAFRLLAQLRVRFYEAIEPLAPAALAGQRSGDLLSRIVSDVETLQHFFLRVLAPPLTALLVAVVATLFLRATVPGAVAAVLSLMALAGLGAPAFAAMLCHRIGRRMVRTRGALAAALVDGVQGAADLLALGQAARHADRVDALSSDLVRRQIAVASIGALATAGGSFLANLAMWAALVLAVPLVASSRLEGFLLPVVTLGALACFEGVLALPAAFPHLEANLEAARRLFSLADTPPAVAPPAQPVPVPGGKRIAVEHLRFRYAPGDPPALENVSFTLEPGKRVALVGPSGAGKSTLAALLLRFWDYTDGHISLGGRELRDCEPDQVRQCIAAVPQHSHLLNTTIRANLLLARPEATDAEIARVVCQARLDGWIASLPRGLDTLVGENGLQVSAGERQRLAVARALLKDAPILILDEPTAHLDAATERDVLEAVLAAAAGRSLLLITHRLAGLESMDEILVLDHGRVVERGRHAELLRMRDLYSHMWALQYAVLTLPAEHTARVAA